MRVLVTGASGFIGRAVVEALLRQGDQVVCAARHPPQLGDDANSCETLPVDLSKVPAAQWWVPRLAGVDAVVNAVGILREQGAQTFRALHTDAPSALFQACAAAGVPLVVQVSALGADDQAQSRYHLSKKAADDCLRGLPVLGRIVQPSLVYGPGGPSSQLFNQLAILPLLAFPLAGDMLVQPVHRDDVVDGVLALLRSPQRQPDTIAFVGPRPLRLRDYLAQLRAALRMGGKLRVLRLPEALFRWVASVAGHVPGSSLDSETAAMLLRGNAAPSEPFTRLLGREPRAVPSFIPEPQVQGMRTEAVLGAWLPVLRGAIAFAWLWTGLVSLGWYPVSDSLGWLERVGLHGATAKLALYGGAGLDLLLGAATLAAPARWRGAVWAAQLLLIAGCTLLVTLFLPEFWLHPYAPIAKNVPLAAAIALLWALESRAAPAAALRGVNPHG